MRIRVVPFNAEVGDYSVVITGNPQSPQGTEEDVTPTAMDNVPAVQGLMLYPNPAKDQVTIEFVSAQEGTMHYTIYNMEGEKVMTNLQGIRQGINVVPVNTSSLIKGLYILETENNGEMHRHKFMISR